MAQYLRLATIGFSSLLENALLGTPEFAITSANHSAQPSGDVTIIFSEPVESPDATARAVRGVFEYGLAGERN